MIGSLLSTAGRILASESLDTLRSQLGRNRQLRVEVSGAQAQSVPDVLARLSGVEQVRADQDDEPGQANGNSCWIVEYQGEEIRTEVSRAVLEQGCGLLELRSLEPTLEDMYLQLIRQTQEEQQ